MQIGATRGLKILEVTSESTRQRSPKFPYQTQDLWPQRPDEGKVIDEERELRKQVHTRSTAAVESRPVIFNLRLIAYRLLLAFAQM